MSTRAEVFILEKGTSAEFSRHWDGYPEGLASDLKSVETYTAGSLIGALNLNTELESGVEYSYDFDLDKKEVRAYTSDWKTDTRTDLLFKGSFKEFIENFKS